MTTADALAVLADPLASSHDLDAAIRYLSPPCQEVSAAAGRRG